jgi:hypothetical protein
LFTGDAGGGESNIRRYLIENDWLEAIIQLPNNLSTVRKALEAVAACSPGSGRLDMNKGVGDPQG